MKTIIIGTPGKGKTALAKRIKEDYPNLHIISIDELRSSLGIHEPHKGYETEVAPENTKYFRDVIDGAMSKHNEFVIEGYGLSPEDALWLSEKHNCPVVLLCHKKTTGYEDFALVRKYETPDQPTVYMSDEYLVKLYNFYKKTEIDWIKRMPDEMVFSTDTYFFYAGIYRAYEYIASHQNCRICRPINGDRIAHMVGVAEYMYKNAGKYHLDPKKMYITGLLHDIGYISGNSKEHEKYGAELIQKCFSTDFGMSYIGDVIAHHGETPFDYLKKHGLVPNELHLLWEADMMIDLTGNVVGFKRRLEDIGKRHGFESRAYKNCKQSIEWLEENDFYYADCDGDNAERNSQI